MVLTTYATIETDFRRQQYGFKRQGVLEREPSPLHSVQWFRIVLDEGTEALANGCRWLRLTWPRRGLPTPGVASGPAHSIKDRSSSTARAVFAMKTERKWSLSGTPLQNRVGELYSLIRFMEIEPFSNYFCTQCKCMSFSWRFADYSHCDDCGHKPMQ